MKKQYKNSHCDLSDNINKSFVYNAQDLEISLWKLTDFNISNAFFLQRIRLFNEFFFKNKIIQMIKIYEKEIF